MEIISNTILEELGFKKQPIVKDEEVTYQNFTKEFPQGFIM